MKIMGGKQIPDTGEMGAFVTAIYPILADQLHGELDIGQFGYNRRGVRERWGREKECERVWKKRERGGGGGENNNL